MIDGLNLEAGTVI